MKVFDNACRGFDPFVMLFNVLYKDGQALRGAAAVCGAVFAFLGLRDHDVGIAQIQLGAVDWLAVAVMLDEAEGLRQPGECCADVAIHDVGQDGVGGYGAIF